MPAGDYSGLASSMVKGSSPSPTKAAGSPAVEDARQEQQEMQLMMQTYECIKRVEAKLDALMGAEQQEQQQAQAQPPQGAPQGQPGQ